MQLCVAIHVPCSQCLVFLLAQSAHTSRSFPLYAIDRLTCANSSQVLCGCDDSWATQICTLPLGGPVDAIVAVSRDITFMPHQTSERSAQRHLVPGRIREQGNQSCQTQIPRATSSPADAPLKMILLCLPRAAHHSGILLCKALPDTLAVFQELLGTLLETRLLLATE